RGDDLLAQVGRAAALDQPAVGPDLVGAVDRDVEPREAVEILDGDAEGAGLPLGRHRGGDTAEVLQAASGDRRQQVGDRRTGAEADGHPVLDQLRRSFGGDFLLAVGPHASTLIPHLSESRIPRISRDTRFTFYPRRGWMRASG